MVRRPDKSMKKQIANLTSIVINPFAVSFATIVLLSFESTSTVRNALRWSGVMTGVSVLPIFLVILHHARTGRLDGILDATRPQRKAVYVLTSVCAVTGYILLRLWHAPLLLQASFVGGLAGTVIFMLINLRWKISLHTGFTAAMTAIMVMLYGRAGVLVISLVLLIGWARIELRRHSVGEVTAGALVGSLVVVAVFQIYGLS